VTNSDDLKGDLGKGGRVCPYGLAVVLGDGEARELDGLEVVLASRRRVPDVAHLPRRAIGHRCRGPGGRRPDQPRDETETDGAGFYR
jgi:hypothetical protein